MSNTITPRRPFAHSLSVMIREDQGLKTRLVSIQGSEDRCRNAVKKIPGFVQVIGVTPLSKHKWKGLSK